MREMDDIPRDSNNRQSNILIDDDEIDNNKNEENISNNIINSEDNGLNIQNKEKQKEQNNYLSQMFYKNTTFNIIFFLFFIVLIIIEYIYRQELFTYSLTYEQNLQNSLSKGAILFFKVVTIVGGYVLIGVGLFFVLCYYSLIKTIILYICLIFVVYLHDIMKILYGDPRPFWINTILFQGQCETSYGNPSGHSLISFYFYLSLSYYICMLESVKNNKTRKIIVYLIGIFVACLTAFSRLVLGVHAIDQVLYGGVVGIWMFILFAYIFKIYDIPLSYYLLFYNDKNYINFFITFLIILFIISIILYNLIDIEADFKKYYLVMDKKCPNIEKFKFYSNSCLAESLILLLIVGIYSGQYLFWYFFDKYYYENNHNENNLYSFQESINHWNNQYKEIFSSFGNFIKVIGLAILCILPGLFYVFVSGENNSLRNIFIFKIGLPLFLIGFLFFGPCFYNFLHILKERRDPFV